MLAEVGGQLEGSRARTAGAGVERALIVGFAGLRLANVTQLLVALSGTLMISSRPVLDVALAALFVVQTAVTLAVAMRRGTLAIAVLAWSDVAMGVVVLLGQSLISTDGERVGTWAAWGFAVTVSCSVLAGVALRSRGACAAAAAALMLAYLAVTISAGQPSQVRLGAITNALAYVAFAVVARATTRYLRRLGADADAARGHAGRAGADAESERHRLLLHDQATVLHLIGQGHCDPELETALRAQASAGAAAITAFLTGTSASGAPGSLAEGLRAVAGHFSDLRIVVTVDLVEHLTLPRPDADAIAGAVTTLLHNVRRHAGTRQCVLHADHVDGTWQVLVRDDGVGFDPARTPPGYGLSRQVRAALAGIGGEVHVSSAPGNGTAVTLSGRAGTGP